MGMAGAENAVIVPAAVLRTIRCCHIVASLGWMKHMADAKPPPLGTARTFPNQVPILIDAEAGVTLRAAGSGDLPGMVEQCRDPEMIRWTSVPTPDDGYQLRDAADFLALTAAGWTSGERLGWTIEAQRGSARAFCGSIDLRLED